jgi:beta-glucoside operon transcriptional antiterminator
VANYTSDLWVIFIYTVIYDPATRKHGDRLVDMKFIKNFNNNAALVTNEFGVEWVVVGNGVGFGKKIGDEIDDTKITHRFVAADKTEGLLDSIANVSSETLTLTKEVVHLVETRQETTFNDYGYLALIDHIDFALQRAHKGIDMAGGSSDWEVRKLFPQQYQIAKEVDQ